MKQQTAAPDALHQPSACAHPIVSLVRLATDAAALERASRLFRALGDAPRLRLLHFLLAGEVCVGELVTALGEKFSTVSQRLRVLRAENLVARRRDGAHVYYSLADAHVRDLVTNALAHAAEQNGPTQPTPTEDDE